MYRENKELPVTEKVHPCLRLWRSRIEWAAQNGGFHADHKQATRGWRMCAVGEAREPYGVQYYRDNADAGPVDKPLFGMGCDFADAVEANDFSLCRSIIAAIEQRLAELAR